jgi:hypothetical protein
MSTARAAYSTGAKEVEMRFDDALVQQRGAVVRLVQEGILTQEHAAAELGLSARQVRRLIERLVAAGGAVSSLAYDRTHAAPNRWAAPVRAAVQELVVAQPHASAQALWEQLEARGVAPLPSKRRDVAPTRPNVTFRPAPGATVPGA